MRRKAWPCALRQQNQIALPFLGSPYTDEHFGSRSLVWIMRVSIRYCCRLIELFCADCSESTLALHGGYTLMVADIVFGESYSRSMRRALIMPFEIKPDLPEREVKLKKWVAVSICIKAKTVQLELLSDLS